MSNTTKLPQPVFELVQTLLDVRSQMEDVGMEASSLRGQYSDAQHILIASETVMAAINKALDLVKYNEA